MLVVGGFLSPSSAGYVYDKLGPNTIKFDHRLELCRLLTSPSPWVAISSLAITNGFSCAEKIQKLARAKFPKFAKRLVAYNVYGGDVVWKCQCWNSPMVCVGRHEFTTKIKEAMANSQVHPDFIMVETEVEAMSSTQVRELMKEERTEELTARGWLYPGSLDYMKTAGPDLYMTITDVKNQL